MATASGENWLWSESYRQYYYVSHDSCGQPIQNFAQSPVQPTAPAAPYHQPVPTAQEVYYPQPAGQPTGQEIYYPHPVTQPTAQYGYYQPTAQPTYNYQHSTHHGQVSEPNTQEQVGQLQQLPDFAPRISAEKSGGLDGSYKERKARFFEVGKVFATLYTEPAGAQSKIDKNDDTFSTIKFNEKAHSTIRRFIVITVRHGFVYACPISTYSNRATYKPGCVPSEHAVVYFTGTDPSTCYFEGEKEMGMDKDPIEVNPCTDAGLMKPMSRIRFARLYSIDMNVKVKDIGKVLPQHMSKFLDYCREYLPQ